MKIERFVCGDIEENCYILYAEDGGECMIMDPGEGPGRISRFLKEHGLTPSRIILTHHHPDHTGAIDGLLREYDIPIYIHEAELWRLKWKANELKDGDVLKIGDESLKVIHTPGHSEGSVCFFCPEMKIAFTGDVVFRDETGYTIFDGGSKHQMINSIGSIIDKWDDDTVLYPGHFGMADMAYVKANNPDYRKAMKRYTEKQTGRRK